MVRAHEYWHNFRNSGSLAMEGILAIDPAGPIFEDNNALKLDRNDAKAVQVFHTDTGAFGGGLGYRDWSYHGPEFFSSPKRLRAWNMAGSGSDLFIRHFEDCTFWHMFALANIYFITQKIKWVTYRRHLEYSLRVFCTSHQTYGQLQLYHSFQI